MDNKNRLDCFAFARNDEIVGFEDNKILNQLTATPTHTDSHVSPQLNGSLCKVQDNNVTRHTEDDSPKYLQTQSHVITRNNVEQKGQKSVRSDVVIHNKLCK